jgi:hypothetical protein
MNPKILKEKLEQVWQRAHSTCLSLGMDPRIEFCTFIPLSELLKRNSDGLDNEIIQELLCLDSPFSWGDNNRTLITASRLLSHWQNMSETFTSQTSKKAYQDLLNDLEGLGEKYIDLEN